MRFLSDEQLTEKGIPGSDVTRWRKRKARKLPQRRNFGPRLHGTPEPLIERYLEAIAAGHSEEQATIIAEQYLAALLAKHNLAVVA